MKLTQHGLPLGERGLGFFFSRGRSPLVREYHLRRKVAFLAVCAARFSRSETFKLIIDMPITCALIYIVFIRYNQIVAG